MRLTGGLTTISYHMRLCVFSCLVLSRQTRTQTPPFSEIPSGEDRDKFDSFPLVTRTVKEAAWCDGVQEVKEIREVGGSLYSKEFLLDNTQTRHVIDPQGGHGGYIFYINQPLFAIHLNSFFET